MYFINVEHLTSWLSIFHVFLCKFHETKRLQFIFYYFVLDFVSKILFFTILNSDTTVGSIVFSFTQTVLYYLPRYFATLSSSSRIKL